MYANKFWRKEIAENEDASTLWVRGYGKAPGRTSGNKLTPNSTKRRIPVYNYNTDLKESKDSSLSTYNPQVKSNVALLENYFQKIPVVEVVTNQQSPDELKRNLFHKKKAVDKILQLIDRKLLTGYKGIEERFRNNSDDITYEVSWNDFRQLLHDLVGHISEDEFSALTERLHLNGKKRVSLDDVMKNFTENKTVKILWKNQQKRELLKEDARKRPADHIRDSHRQVSNEEDKQNEEGKAKMMTAVEVMAYFRIMAKENPAKVKRIFSGISQNEKNFILKPQMSKAISSLAIVMYLEEFEKFWHRLDFARIGMVQCKRFFRMIGLTEDTRKEKFEKEGSKALSVSKEANRPSIQEDKALFHSQVKRSSEDVSDKEAASNNNEEADKVLDFDIKYFLTQKFKEGRQLFLNAWNTMSSNERKYMTKEDFRSLLARFRIYLTPNETDSFLLRYRIREETLVLTHFLDKFLQMTNFSAKRIMSPFSRGLSPKGSLSTISRAEDLLMDLIYKEYIGLARELSYLEQSAGGCLLVQDFVKLLNRLYSLKLTVPSVRRSLCKYKLIKDMIVDWSKLLELCTGIRSSSSKCHSPVKVTEKRSASSSLTNFTAWGELPSDRQKEFTLDKQNSNSAKQTRVEDVQETKSQQSSRTETPLDEPEQVFEQNCDRINEVTQPSNSEKQDHFTEDSLQALLQSFGLQLTCGQLKSLWSALPAKCTDKDGVRNLQEILVKLPNRSNGKSMPKDADLTSGVSHKTKEHGGFSRSSELAGDLLNLDTKNTAEELSEKDFNQRPCAAEPCLTNEEKEHARPLSQCRATSKDEETSQLESSDGREIDESYSDQGDVRHFFHRLRKEVTENWYTIQRKLQARDQRGLGFVDIDTLKNIINELNIEIPSKALDYIQREYSSSANPKVIDHIQLFEAIKKKTSSHYEEEENKSTTPQSLVQEKPNPCVAVMEKIKTKFQSRRRYLRRAFKKADIDHDGCLTQPELRNVIKSFGVKIDNDELYHIFSTFDYNFENKICYDEFLFWTFVDQPGK